MESSLQPNSDSLVSLLRSWNGYEISLTPENCEDLIRLARLELGATETAASCEAADVDELSSTLQPLLPTNHQGQTIADVFTELRDRASRELKTPAGMIRWETAWASIDSARPMALCDSGDLLEVVLTECKAALDEPLELVGETVRCIWKARGGRPFWHLPPYEHNWCASQSIFYDLRQTPLFHQRADVGRIEPSTPLSRLISKKKHAVLLGTIESRFGVWLGRREKEGCLPVLIAGILASPLSMMVGACLVVGIAGTGTHAVILAFATWGVCIGVAATIYVRSQPRLPPAVRTVKDIVRAIVHKRRNCGIQKNRLRPISVSSNERRQ